MSEYISRLTHCTFTCKDYPAMEVFYKEKLGLKKLFKIDFTPEIIADFRARGYDLKAAPGDEWLSYYKVAPKEFIELFNVPYEGENQTDNQGFHHVCLMVEDIVAAARELESKGVVIWTGPRYANEPYTGPYPGNKCGQCGSLGFFVQDPEGNEIEFMQFTKDSLQVLNDHD